MRLMNVKEIDRDEELGILRKRISIADIFSFETPSKSIKYLMPDVFLDSNLRVNEITRKVDYDLLNSLEEGATTRIARDIRSNFKRDILNLVIFNLIFDQISNENLLRTLSQHLYASSDATIFLPTVKVALLKKDDRFSDSKIKQYLDMIDNIIREIEAVGNSKVFIGTIPLIPIRYSRPIVKFYLDKGMTAFAIDANTKDVLLNEADFRSILSEINDAVPLNETFIYACNLGYPQFEKFETRADDFLSIFTYVDVLGGTFKIRGIPVGKPRLKAFSRERYLYKILASSQYSMNTIKNYNQSEQLREANKMRDLVGAEKIEPYIQNKTAVDQPTIKRLRSIASKIKVD